MRLPLLLHLAGVDDIHHVVNGNRGLSDVGGDDDLCDTLWRPAENGLLLLIGQGGVKRVHHAPDEWVCVRQTQKTTDVLL